MLYSAFKQNTYIIYEFLKQKINKQILNYTNTDISS